MGKSHDLADRVARFAARLQEADGDSSKLTQLIIEAAVTIIPGAEFAGVRRLSGARSLQTDISTESELTDQLTHLHNTTGEGPALDAILTDRQIVVDDLATDQRWPLFAPAAARLGVVAMLSTPMKLRNHTPGCLALINTTGRFDDEAASLARIFAVHASIALSGAIHQESLQTALGSREVIGQAKGILMERCKLTDEGAFAALVKTSADNNVKLHTVCVQLVRTGELPTKSPPRAAQSARRLNR